MLFTSIIDVEHALGILSLKIIALGHQNNNFFAREWAKMAVLFNSRFLYRVALAQLLITGLDKGKQMSPLFKHFSCFCCYSLL